VPRKYLFYAAAGHAEMASVTVHRPELAALAPVNSVDRVHLQHVLLISRRRGQGQRDVVCKKRSWPPVDSTGSRINSWGAASLLFARLCWRPGRAAKPQQHNALGLKPSCCLQDSAPDAFGHGAAVGGDSVPPAEDGPCDREASNQDAPCATCLDSPNTLAGKPDRKRSSAGDNRGGVAAGSRAGCKPVAEDGKEQAERLADSIDNGDRSSGGSGSE
jgi:hypothetical protein